jgi:hypothetical protein
MTLAHAAQDPRTWLSLRGAVQVDVLYMLSTDITLCVIPQQRRRAVTSLRIQIKHGLINHYEQALPRLLSFASQ